MDTRLVQRAQAAKSTTAPPYRAAVAVLVFAIVSILSAPATAADDPLPAAKPLGEPLPGPATPFAGHFHAYFSADGKTILASRTPLGRQTATEARLWNAATGKPLGPPLSFSGGREYGPPVGVALHEKTVLTYQTGSKIQLWDAATGKRVWGPVMVDGRVVAVAFSPDGKTVLTGGTDRTARLWDAANGNAIGDALPHPNGVLRAAFSPDGKLLATGTGSLNFTEKVKGEVRLWDVETRKPRGEPLPHERSVSYLGFSSDGKTVLTAGGFRAEERDVRIWVVATVKPLAEPLRLPKPPWPEKNILYSAAVAYSPDGQTVLTGTAEKTAHLYDAVTGKARGEPLRHADLVYAAAFTRDGKILLTASGRLDQPSEVRLWDVATGKAFCRVPHEGDVVGVAFSPDGKVVLIASKREARMWQVPELSK